MYCWKPYKGEVLKPGTIVYTHDKEVLIVGDLCPVGIGSNLQSNEQIIMLYTEDCIASIRNVVALAEKNIYG